MSQATASLSFQEHCHNAAVAGAAYRECCVSRYLDVLLQHVELMWITAQECQKGLGEEKSFERTALLIQTLTPVQYLIGNGEISLYDVRRLANIQSKIAKFQTVFPKVGIPKDSAELSVEEVRRRYIESPGKEVAEELLEQGSRVAKFAALENSMSTQWKETGWAKYPISKHKETDSAVGYACGARRSMEDRYLITKIAPFKEELPLFAVFDGHAGSSMAEYCKENFAKILSVQLAKEEALSDESIYNALYKTCIVMHRSRYVFLETPLSLYGDSKVSRSSLSGTTACVALRVQDHIWCANVGDSRAAFADGTLLSEDALLQIPKYRAEVMMLGGKVKEAEDGELRVNDHLNMARAIGDFGCNLGINPAPTITKTKIPDAGTTLVVATDGLWGLAKASDISESLTHHASLPLEEKAVKLVQTALDSGIKDNVTVILAELKPTLSSTSASEKESET